MQKFSEQNILYLNIMFVFLKEKYIFDLFLILNKLAWYFLKNLLDSYLDSTLTKLSTGTQYFVLWAILAHRLEEPGLEPTTLQVTDLLLYCLSHCCPIKCGCQKHFISPETVLFYTTWHCMPKLNPCSQSFPVNPKKQNTKSHSWLCISLEDNSSDILHVW